MTSGAVERWWARVDPTRPVGWEERKQDGFARFAYRYGVLTFGVPLSLLLDLVALVVRHDTALFFSGEHAVQLQFVTLAIGVPAGLLAARVLWRHAEDRAAMLRFTRAFDYLPDGAMTGTPSRTTSRTRAPLHAGTELAQQVGAEGWAITPPVVREAMLDELVEELLPLLQTGARGGMRHLLDLPSVRILARSDAVRAVAESVLGADCVAVRGILFDKTPDANWKVTWHQDLTIAVRERRDVAGYGPWTEKEGVPHVQPPVEVLQRMLAVRVHLDDCGLENGPVRVIPRSHRDGRLSPDAIDDWKQCGPVIDCVVQRGGILTFRPLLLHASSPAMTPAHRRVIHLEFAAAELDGGLEWYHAV